MTRPTLARRLPWLLLPLLLTSRADAGELVVATGPSAGITTWRTDAFLTQGFQAGYKPIERLAFDVAGRAGYGTVDQRMMAGIGLGVTAYVLTGGLRPYARLGLLHQHEEPVSNVREKPLETLSAVGPDVRHRSAAQTSIGLEIRAVRVKKTEVFFAVDALATFFADSRGPSVYGGGQLWLGMLHGL